MQEAQPDSPLQGKQQLISCLIHGYHRVCICEERVELSSKILWFIFYAFFQWLFCVKPVGPVLALSPA